MRAAEPMRQDAVLGYPVQNAIRTYDGGVDGSGEHQNTDEHNKSLKTQSQIIGSDKIHGQTADQISEVLGPNRIRNDHGGKE